jgi:hypothetical protein
MIRTLILTIAILVAAIFPRPTNAQVAGCDGAGNCYIRAAAAGAGTGADWTNAYTNFGTSAGMANPASLTRGVAYYVAAGTYNATTAGYEFNTPDSGSLVIKIQAATTSSHGTATGWSNAFQGPAIWSMATGGTRPIINFDTDFWTFSGEYNACGTRLTEPFLPCRSGYGFAVNNNNGSNKPVSSLGVQIDYAAIGGATTAVNNVTIEFVEFIGDSDATGSNTVIGSCAGALGVQTPEGAGPAGGVQSTNDALLYSYAHDDSGGPVYMNGTANFVLDHNWFNKDWGFNYCGMTNCSGQPIPNSCHSEIGIKNANFTGTSNITISNNFIENLGSTAPLADPGSGGGANCQPGALTSACTSGITGMNIFGNVFFCNTAEWTFTSGVSLTDCPGGNGFIGIFNYNNTGINVYNNTFDGATGAHGVLGVSGGAIFTANFQNNLFTNDPAECGLLCFIPTSSGGSACTLTYGFNAYQSANRGSDPGYSTAASDTTTGVPAYINAGKNTANANNYGLATDTAAWTPLSSPFNVDPLGHVRTSSRGAFQFTGPSAAVSFLWSATVNPSTVLLGSFPVTATSSVQAVTICNGSISTGGVCTASSATVTISTMVLGGVNSGDFLFTTSPSGGNDCGGSLAAGATCVISFTIKPSIIGPESATFTVTDSASGSPQSFSVTGTGISQLSVSPASQSFGNVPITTPSSELLTALTNNGSTTITSLALSITGTSSSFYVIDTTSTTLGGISNCAKITSLAPTATCNAGVTFEPTIPGNGFVATLNFADSALGSPQTAGLSGNGTGTNPVVPAATSIFASATRHGSSAVFGE